MSGIQGARHDSIAPQRALGYLRERLIIADADSLGERIADEEHAPIVGKPAARPESVLVVTERAAVIRASQTCPLLDRVVRHAPLNLKGDAILPCEPQADLGEHQRTGDSRARQQRRDGRSADGGRDARGRGQRQTLLHGAADRLERAANGRSSAVPYSSA